MVALRSPLKLWGARCADLSLEKVTLVSLFLTSFNPLVKGASSSSSSEESLECVSTGTSGNCGGKMAQELLHVDFEVHGTVQGVFFRKYTQQEGNKLGLRGFCRNTSQGTVSGEVEGPRSAVEKMKQWLQHTGSPMSRISSANFLNEKVIDSYTFPPGFDIKRTI